MTHEYNITGMTCMGCVNGVRNKLINVPGVTEADVRLTGPQATIVMNRHIPAAELQAALGNGKYTITDVQPQAQAQPVMGEEEAAAGSDSYYPIFLIFGYIAGVTLLVQLAGGAFNLMHWMGHFMAGFFVVFSFFKLLNMRGFAEGYKTYDIIAARWNGYAYIYPFIELGLGIAYITGFEPFATNVVTLVVMSISTVGVVQSLLRKRTIQCACLGTIIKLPLSKVTLFEDVLMVAMSAAALVIG